MLQDLGEMLISASFGVKALEIISLQELFRGRWVDFIRSSMLVSKLWMIANSMAASLYRDVETVSGSLQSS
jgi:hypothetical protein